MSEVLEPASAQAGLLGELGRREADRFNPGLVLPGTLRELREPLTDRVAKLLDDPQVAIRIDGNDQREVQLLDDAVHAIAAVARRIASSRTRIQRFS